MTKTSEKIMKLRLSSNNDSDSDCETIVEVPGSIFNEMTTLSEMIADMSEMGGDSILTDVIDIPLDTIDVKTLNMVVQYYRLSQKSEKQHAELLMDWEKDFFGQIGNESFEILLKLLSASNYLNCKSILDKGCKYVSHLIKNKTVEELRDYFGVENDFTPDEEEKIKNEFSWAIDQE
jgi:S-phase kinase-associated protein 1